MGKANDYLLRFIIHGCICPSCHSKLSIIFGKIDDKPAQIIECIQNKHRFQFRLQFQPLALEDKPVIKAGV